MGLISDTHGLLRPGALEALVGCQHIIHGGDIGGPHILEELRSIAPLTVVRGNNDTGSWAEGLRVVARIRVGGIGVYAIHNLSEIDTVLDVDHVRVVVFGHSHKPSVEERRGVLYVNPGSAGPRRFKLPVTLGELTIDGASVTVRIIPLDQLVATTN